MRAYFFTALGFAPPILMALFCLGVIGLALGAMSRRLSGHPGRNRWSETIPRTVQELAGTPDRRQARAWIGQEVPEPQKGEHVIRGNTLVDAPGDLGRMEALEEWATMGCVELGVEIDGGVYLSVYLLGGPEIELREQNSIRDAIDKARKEIKP